MREPDETISPPPLLLRRVPDTSDQLSGPLFAAVAIGETSTRRLAADRGVLALCDLGGPLDAEPLAVLVLSFRLDRRAARIVALAVEPTMRRAGLGRRLLADALALLRADGCTELEGWAVPGAPFDALLRAVGFGDAGPDASVDAQPDLPSPPERSRRLAIEL